MRVQLANMNSGSYFQPKALDQLPETTQQHSCCMKDHLSALWYHTISNYRIPPFRALLLQGTGFDCSFAEEASTYAASSPIFFWLHDMLNWSTIVTTIRPLDHWISLRFLIWQALPDWSIKSHEGWHTPIVLHSFTYNSPTIDRLRSSDGCWET